MIDAWRLVRLSIIAWCTLISACEGDNRNVADAGKVREDLKNSNQIVAVADPQSGSGSTDGDLHDGLIVALAVQHLQIEPGVDLQLIFTVENLTQNAVMILPWGTPMEKVLSADIFDVEYQGEKLRYLGRVVKRAEPTASDYLQIPVGVKQEFAINLSQAYDTRSAGLYSVQLKSPGGLFRLDKYAAQVSSRALLIERL